MKVDLNTDLDKINIIYPVIVKPTDRSGSRGIFKVEDSRDLADSVKKIPLNKVLVKKGH